MVGNGEKTTQGREMTTYMRCGNLMMTDEATVTADAVNATLPFESQKHEIEGDRLVSKEGPSSRKLARLQA